MVGGLGRVRVADEEEMWGMGEVTEGAMSKEVGEQV